MEREWSILFTSPPGKMEFERVGNIKFFLAGIRNFTLVSTCLAVLSLSINT